MVLATGLEGALKALVRVSPFPSPLDDPRSVLAVKGPLRRFVPWTAPGRSEGMTVYEGKRGGSGRVDGPKGNLSVIPELLAAAVGRCHPQGRSAA